MLIIVMIASISALFLNLVKNGFSMIQFCMLFAVLFWVGAFILLPEEPERLNKSQKYPGSQMKKVFQQDKSG